MRKRPGGPVFLFLTIFLLSGSGASGAESKAKPAASKPKAAWSKPASSKVAPSKPAAKKPVAKPAKAAVLERAAKPTAPVVQKTTEPAPPRASKSTDRLPGDPSKLVKKFDSGRSGLTLRFSGVESRLKTMSAFVMPGEALEIEASGGSGLYAASSRTGVLVADEKKPKWTWTAPAEHGGDHRIRIRDRKPGRTDAVVLRVFVLRPYDGGPTIDDYPIGTYQPPPAKNAEAFAPPRGFVEVTDDNVDTQVSPHFTLGQFVCKDGFEGTRYLALKPALLLKLEKVLEVLAKRGLPAKTLQVFSGFRTPAYNARIGNETGLSRHLYGDAADVYLDRDGDGEMDDLDGDGLIAEMDASVLHNLIDEAIDAGKSKGPLAGGLSTYLANPSHGPFVHIDTRGVRVRW